MNPKSRWILYTFLIVAIIYGIIVKAVVPHYLKDILPLIPNMSKEYINGSVSVKDITWNGGLHIKLTDVELISDKDELIAKVPTLNLSVAPLNALFDINKLITKIDVEKPIVYLREDEKGYFEIEGLMKPSDSDSTPFYGLVNIADSKIMLITPQGEWEVNLTGSLDAAANPNFALDVTLAHQNDKLLVQGLVNTKLVGKLNFKTEEFSLTSFSPLLATVLPAENIAGKIQAVNVLWDNNDGKVVMAGNGAIDSLKADIVYDDYNLPIEINGKISFNDSRVILDGLDIDLDNNIFSLNCDLDIKDLENIQGSGLLKSEKIVAFDRSLSKLVLPFVFNQGKLQINTAKVDFGGGDLKLLTEYDLKSGTLIGALDFAHVTIDKLPQRENDKLKLDGSIVFDGTFKDEQIKLNLVADNTQIAWNNLYLRNITLDADFTQETLKINNFAAFTNDGAIITQGIIGLDGKFDLKGRMTEVPLEPIFAELGENGSGSFSMEYSLKGNLDDINFDSISQFKNVKVAGITLEEAHGEIVVKNNFININDYQVHMAQGTSVINGTATLQEEPNLNLEIVTNNIRMEPLIKLVAPDVRLTGNVDNTLNVKGTVKDLSITGIFTLTDGSAEGYLIDKILTKYSYNNDILDIEKIGRASCRERVLR